MTNLEVFYIKAAFEYEDMTVKLSVQVDSIILSVRSLENTFQEMGIKVSKISEGMIIDTTISPSALVHSELRVLIDALASLKEMVKITLTSVIHTTNLTLTQIADDMRATEWKTIPCSKAEMDFRATLAKCIDALVELDKDLFNTEIDLIHTFPTH